MSAEENASQNWLTAEFQRARERRESLPKWARPVRVNPPGSGNGGVPC